MADRRIYELQTTTENTGKYFAIDQSGLTSAQKLAADSFYLKSETDGLLANYYTKTEVDALLAGYYTKGEIDTALADYYTSAQVDNLLLAYYTSAQVDQLFTLYYTELEIDAILTNYYTILEVEPLIEARLRWMGAWVAADYVANDVVRDDAWLMVANKATTDRPAPQPSGDPYYIYAGIPGADTALASQVIFGTRYLWEVGGYLTGLRLYTHSGVHYQVFSVKDPLGAAIRNEVLEFTATEDGWQDLALDPQIVFPGAEFDLVAVANQPDPSPVTWQGDWDYNTPNNPGIPGPGNIIQSNQTPGILVINKTDQAAGDRSAELLALNLGDTIEALGTSWLIQSSTDEGTAVSFGVAPATQASPDGVTTFTFSTVAPTPIPYEEDPDFWLTNPFAQGLLGIDQAYSNIVPNQNAYGIDIQVQRASVSEDWDAMALSGGSSGGGGGGSTGGIVWLGSTPNAVGTYENPTTIRAQANLLFDGSELSTPSIKLSLGSTVDNIETTLTDNTDRIATSSAIFAALGSVSSPWEKTGTSLSPVNLGDDILLNANEALFFRNNTTGLTSQSTNGMRLIAAGESIMDFYASNINLYKSLYPTLDNSIKLGDVNGMWAGVSSHKYEIGKTAIYIAYSGDSMTFTDAIEGTVSLSDLVGDGATYTFENGLTESLGTVKLGGTLGSNTNIAGAGSYFFNLGTFDDPIFQTKIYVDDFFGIYFNDNLNITGSASSTYFSCSIENGKREFRLSTSDINIKDESDFKGAKYDGDYSVNGIANIGDRWIPDYGAVKAYADSVAGDSFWQQNGTDLSPLTAGNDILLNNAEIIKFRNADNSIGSSAVNDLHVIINGAIAMQWSVSQVSVGKTFQPNANASYNLGNPSNYWLNSYVWSTYYGSSATKVGINGTDLEFTDANAGTHTLSELLSGGGLWTADTDGIFYSGNVGIGGNSQTFAQLTILGSKRLLNLTDSRTATAWDDAPTALPDRTMAITRTGTLVNSYAAYSMQAKGGASYTAYAVMAVQALALTNNTSRLNFMLRGGGSTDYWTPLSIDWDSKIHWKTQRVSGDITHLFTAEEVDKYVMGYDASDDVFSIKAGGFFSSGIGLDIHSDGNVSINGGQYNTLYKLSVNGQTILEDSDDTIWISGTSAPTPTLRVYNTITNNNNANSTIQLRLARSNYINVGFVYVTGTDAASNRSSVCIAARDVNGLYYDIFKAAGNGSIYLPRFTSAAASLDVQFNNTTKQLYYVSSDITEKENIIPIGQDAMDLIRAIEVVQFDRIDGSGTDEPGVIAQQIQELRGDFVIQQDGGKLAVKNNHIRWNLLRAFQLLADQVDELQTKLDKYETE